MKHGSKLPLDRCPHCSVALPTIHRLWGPQETTNFRGGNKKFWAIHQCASCGGVVLACSPGASSNERDIDNIWPQLNTVHDAIPQKAREYLSQAIASQHAPAGAVMLTASSIDSMLKDKGYTEGNLYSRIDSAAQKHLITQEMAAWAHEIRLDANDQRHADEEAPLPSEADAEKAIEFARALAQFLYVLPARVQRGRTT